MRADGRLLSLLLVGSLMSACPAPSAIVLVEARTNFQAGIEFDRVVVTIHPGTSRAALDLPPVANAERDVTTSTDGRGFQVAEMAGIPLGSWVLAGRLMLGDREVALDYASFEMTDTSKSLTLLFSSECASVECSTGMRCVAGTCVDDRCTPEALEFCPMPACGTDAECDGMGGPADCAAGLCFAGICTTWLDDGACASGVCDPVMGCVVGEEVGHPEGLVAGQRHTCVLQDDAQVYCWGHNRFGELGQEPPSGLSLTPVLVPGLPNVVDITSYDSHNCALTQDGEVYCWGLFTFEWSGSTVVATPLLITGLSNIVDLAAGAEHACAVDAAGDVFCWGDEDMGQLAGRRPLRGLAALTQVTDVVEITAGGSHTCVRHGDGAVSCWGGGFGRDVHTIDGLSGVVEVRAGGSAMCARQETGEVLCWTDAAAVPERVPGLVGATELALGWEHACALTRSGEVLCWGRNSAGQIGDGTLSVSRALPTRATGIDDAIEISAGLSHTCARRAGGQVMCWGSENEGKLGNGRLDFETRPGAVAGVTDAAEVVAGWNHTCARLSSGMVVCWGDNEAGQLGNGNTDGQAVPGPVMELANVVQLTAGEEHTCARQDDGTVLCWGNNASAQLGDDSLEPRLLPTAIPSLDAVDVSAGARHTCATRRTGEIVCWGDGTNGKLGMGPRDPSGVVTVNPVAGLTDIQQLSAGGNHTCARTGARAVFCWGSNQGGQLGDPMLYQSDVPLALPGVADAIDVSTSRRFRNFGNTCVVRSSGAVQCWGSNGSAQLGGPGRWLDPVPGITDAEHVDVGRLHVCAMRAAGVATCWGYNAFGQVGDGNGTGGDLEAAPVEVMGLSGVSEITTGETHTCARTGGTVLCWGRNDHAQLGRRPLWSPVEVLGLDTTP